MQQTQVQPVQGQQQPPQSSAGSCGIVQQYLQQHQQFFAPQQQNKSQQNVQNDQKQQSPFQNVGVPCQNNPFQGQHQLRQNQGFGNQQSQINPFHNAPSQGFGNQQQRVHFQDVSSQNQQPISQQNQGQQIQQQPHQIGTGSCYTVYNSQTSVMPGFPSHENNVSNFGNIVMSPPANVFSTGAPYQQTPQNQQPQLQQYQPQQAQSSRPSSLDKTSAAVTKKEVQFSDGAISNTSPVFDKDANSNNVVQKWLLSQGF